MLFLTTESRSDSQAIEDIFNFILRSNLLENAKNMWHDKDGELGEMGRGGRMIQMKVLSGKKDWIGKHWITLKSLPKNTEK